MRSETNSGSSATESDADDEWISDIDVQELLDDNDDDAAVDYDINHICGNIENLHNVIYEGTNMSVEESILSIMDLYIKHRWTKSNLRDTLRMIQIMLPKDNRIPNTVYKLFQYLQNLTSPILIQKHY